MHLFVIYPEGKRLKMVPPKPKIEPKMTAILLLLCYIFTNVPNMCHAQQQQLSFISLQPYFIKNMDSHNIKENTPVDEVIYTLEAQVDQSHSASQSGRLNAVGIVYGIEGTHLFGVNKTSGQVRVAHPIDREQTGDSLTFQVIATPYFMNRPGTPAQQTITVFVIDENDNPPKIERVRVAGHGQDYDSAALARSTYNYPMGGRLINLAGSSSSLTSVTNRPPLIRFNVSESTPIDSVIVDLIEAIDVDKASSNPLSAICLDCNPEFELKAKTANLLNDRLEWSIVLARQLTHVPRNNIRLLHVIVSDGKYNSSITFEATIDDVQNKPPQFIGSTTCIVRENVPIDKTIMTMQAVDGDAIALDDNSALLQQNQQILGGRQIIYDFVDSNGHSSSQQASFKLHPLTGQLQVADRLDREAYLSINAVLSFQVRARELNVDAQTIAAGDDLYESMLNKLISFVDPSEDATSIAEVTVILIDVNDNPPHWLNMSEITALNMNLSPYWHNSLPNDRDTGRNYQLQVRENSPAGTVLTTKNQMFVYDLDSGENAEFNITIEDPFNLFDVEPKRVSGFASITLKLGTQARSGMKTAAKLLDYENINERSYIIQLHAIETKTNEMFRSKAQIQINVLDVNDNAPEFKEPAYLANIREDAPPGKIVKLIQATDRDEVSKQITYSLHGESSYLFDINSISGLITVSKCEQHSTTLQSNSRFAPSLRTAYHHQNNAVKSCIDFELQRSHHLMVEANDGELSTKVPLTVFIDDASDNAPVFALPIVDVVIEEGAERLEPPIRVEAFDADQTSVLSYSIVEGNFEGLFSINNSTGEIQLTRPIRIAHDDLSSSATTAHIPPEFQNQAQIRQQHLNKMTLIVQATDGQHTTNGTIRIDILDANDNAPKFMRPVYEKDITEAYSPGQSVLTVRAFDLDRGNNAKVSYRIERGSYSQFEINQTSGEILVAQNAQPFDASKKENYTIEVVAYDNGLISKNSSVFVNIKVLNTSKRAPEFFPPIQRTVIFENTLNNTIIHRMSVIDTLGQQRETFTTEPVMMIFEPGPIEALDKNGQPVIDTDRLESMFSVSTNTGDVAVNSALDHDFAAYVNLTIFASYKNLTSFGQNDQIVGANFSSDIIPIDRQLPQVEEYVTRSTGYLVINVVDDNNNPPVFAAPWSPAQPELSFQMQEELPVGSVLTQLVASDADSKISHFKIEPPSEYFELASPQSGVVITRKLIDYDALMRQTFVTPGSHRTTSPHQQSASLITQQQSNNILQFNVFVYDSGVPQLSAKAIVSVEIQPINDMDCKFEQQVYDAHVKENSSPDIVVTQVRANDLDFGEQHNTVSYQLIGDHKDLFNIDSRTGVVTVSNKGSLNLDRERLGQSGVISLTVIGRDEQSSSYVAFIAEAPVRSRYQRTNQVLSHSCSTTLRIHVDDVNDNPPLFSQKVYETLAYDTDTIDVPLIKLFVRDEDSLDANSAGTTGYKLTNSFKILSGNINDIFNISTNGVIYVTRALTESISSIKQPIELRVQVKQQSLSGIIGQGVPTMFTDECLVRINLLKINRYAPEWKLETLKGVAIEENMKPGSVVTHLKCIDKDFQEKRGASTDQLPPLSRPKLSYSSIDQRTHPIRYWIKENGTNVLETTEFKLDPVTGSLTTRVELDRESQEFYQLIVTCEDNGKPQSLESITPLYITVLDVDDNKPEFVVPKDQRQQVGFNHAKSASNEQVFKSKQTLIKRDKIPIINFSVEEHQSKGLQIGELKAIDQDLKSQFPIIYCLIEGNEFQEFILDQVTGILYTNQTLDRERQSLHNLMIKATNDGSSCDEYISYNNLTTPSEQTTSKLYTKREAPASQNYGLVIARIEVLDINDNAPIFKRTTYRAGVHHRSLMNTLVTQVAAYDSDSGANGTLTYRITEILMYKTNLIVQQQVGTRGRYDTSTERESISKPIKLIQSPFKIDHQGNIFTQQLLTQYQLMSMFVLQIEATEQSEPYRVVTTKLEIYIYETNSQLKIRINLHPRLVEAFRFEIETLMSNATKYTAIINRARSYYGTELKSSQPGSQQSSQQSAPVPTLDLASNQVPSTSFDLNEPNYSTIYMIFVDNHRIVNPNLVMEKFDLTSAQLFTAQSLTQQFKSNGNDFNGRHLNEIISNEQANDVSSLIDRIALASTQTSEYHFSPSSLIGIDWLESPSVLFVTLAGMLTTVGLIFCLTGCCCTSRIKDHIIKVAMDKLVKQQTLQAKINERVFAATNQSYGNNSIDDVAQLAQHGGLMSSFDATKRCMSNNYENTNLQRAMDADEFVNTDYLTLNGHVNIGAHYYDASDLDQNDDQYNVECNGANMGKDTNGSTISLSAIENIEDSCDNHITMHESTPDVPNNNNPMKEQKLYTNGLNGVVSTHSRLRQQVPPSSNK